MTSKETPGGSQEPVPKKVLEFDITGSQKGGQIEALGTPLGHLFSLRFSFFFFCTSLSGDLDAKCLQNGSKTEPGEEPGDL